MESVNLLPYSQLNQIANQLGVFVAGAKIGTVAGAAVGVETGTGAVITGLVGGIIFGAAGYYGADWIADYIDEN